MATAPLVFQLVNFASDHQVVSDPAALAGLGWLRILGATISLAGVAMVRRIRDPFRFEIATDCERDLYGHLPSKPGA